MYVYNNDIELINYCGQFDIIGICETWQYSDDEFSGFLPGYTNFDSPRNIKRGK